MKQTPRQLHPDQYAHDLVGRSVAYIDANKVKTGIVQRVVRTQIGLLAILDSLPANEAVAVSLLTVVSEPVAQIGSHRGERLLSNPRMTQKKRARDAQLTLFESKRRRKRKPRVEAQKQRSRESAAAIP